MKKKMNAEMMRNDFDPNFSVVPNKYSSEYHDYLNSVNAIKEAQAVFTGYPNPCDRDFDEAACKRYNRFNESKDWELNDANYR